MGSPEGRGRGAALGSPTHEASQHQASMEGEPAWRSAGRQQPPSGAAGWSPPPPDAPRRPPRWWKAPGASESSPGVGRDAEALLPPSSFLFPSLWMLFVLAPPVVPVGSFWWPPYLSLWADPAREASSSPASSRRLAEREQDRARRPTVCLICGLVCCPPFSLSPDIQVGLFKVCVGCNNSYQ